MAGVGLTHGAFYGYFKRKSELYTEVLGCFFTNPYWKNCWKGVEVDLASADVAPQIIRACLSRHLEDVDNACLWSPYRPTLPAAAKARNASMKPCSERWFASWTELGREWQASPHRGASHVRSVRGRHGRGPGDGQPDSGRRIARRVHDS
jgi:AcrR family transcriptional regulator